MQAKRQTDCEDSSTAIDPIKAAQVGNLVDRIDALPTLPVVAAQVGQLVNDPRSSARRIAEVMRGDPALCAKVLRLVNSPYFGIPNGVSDITQAISFVGFNTLHQLVLTVSIFQTVGTAGDQAARNLYRHSLAVAAASEAIAETIRHPTPGACFTAGLLHDLGRLATLQADRTAFDTLSTFAETKHVSIHEAEQNLQYPHHEMLGFRLAKRWRFPLALQATISNHHCPSRERRSAIAHNLHPAVDVTVLADAICHRLQLATHDEEEEQQLPEQVLERLNLLPSVEQKIYDQLRWKIDKSELLLQILMG